MVTTALIIKCKEKIDKVPFDFTVGIENYSNNIFDYANNFCEILNKMLASDFITEKEVIYAKIEINNYCLLKISKYAIIIS